MVELVSWLVSASRRGLMDAGATEAKYRDLLDDIISDKWVRRQKNMRSEIWESRAEGWMLRQQGAEYLQVFYVSAG